MKRFSGLAMGLAVAACTPEGVDLHDAVHSAKAEEEAHEPPARPHPDDVTVDIQGGRMDCTHAMVRGFYAISREAFAGGADKIDLETYKQKTFAFMREIVLKEGGTAQDAEGWIDHVKDIPRQMIGIVKTDPKVLDTCETFSIALSGPP